MRSTATAAIKFSIQRMVCTGCGAEANASCNCGKAYMPKAARAAEAVAANPEKSDRAIAAEIGVSHPTVAAARKEIEATGKDLPVERTGLDGKTRRIPERVTIESDRKDCIALYQATQAAEGEASEAKRQYAWALFEQGKSQVEIASQIGVSQSTVSKYLRGDRNGPPRQTEPATVSEAVNAINHKVIADYLGAGDIVEQALALLAKMNPQQRDRFDAAYTLRFCDPTVN